MTSAAPFLTQPVSSSPPPCSRYRTGYLLILREPRRGVDEHLPLGPGGLRVVLDRLHLAPLDPLALAGEILRGDGEFRGRVGRSGVRARTRIDDGRVGRLPLVVGVEDQRVLAEPPGAAVAEPPERHALDHVLVLDEDREQLRVRVRLGLEVLRRRRGDRAPRAAGAELAPRGPADRHVQFRDADLQPQRGVVLDRLVDGVVGDVGRAPVALDPHAVDRRAVLDQPPEQHHRALVLGADLDAVVVVVQPGVRVGVVGVLEREREELRPHGPQPLRVAEVLRLGRLGVAAVVDRLVDDVPAPDLPLVPADQRGDVVLHPLGDDLLVAAGEEPGVRLGVPHEGVAEDGELVLAAPLHQGVGPLEVPPCPRRGGPAPASCSSPASRR